jgi:DNA-binding transcriptional LysR family regulator
MGEARSPTDLNAHDGIISDVGRPDSGWLIYSGGGRERVFPRARLVSNETSVLLAGALAGLGVSCLPDRTCRPAVDEGRLVRVLPQHHAGVVTTTLLMPPRRADLPAVRKVVDFVVARMSSPI